MAAKLIADVGPCDDEAYLFINGRTALVTRLGECRHFVRDLTDGDYHLRFRVINSGGWAWRAKFLFLVNEATLANVDEVGGSGLYKGEVFEQEWEFRIENSQLLPS